MATLLDGRLLAARIETRLAEAIGAGLAQAGRPPGLAVLRVGDDPASGVYVANKEKACSRVGITNLGAHLAADTPAAEVLATIERLNADPAVDGILLQLPLPAGKRAVVVGRSILVGQPMALMLQAANATVTVAHSRTGDLAALTRQADVLVVAAGRPGMIGAEHVQPGAVVVDVGIHRRPEGGLCGDVRFDEVEPIASAISPVPGGVGPMTVTMLLVNTVTGWCGRCGLTNPLTDLLP